MLRLVGYEKSQVDKDWQVRSVQVSRIKGFGRGLLPFVEIMVFFSFMEKIELWFIPFQQRNYQQQMLDW